MALFELIFSALIIAIVPVGTFLGIQRTSKLWPLTFLTFLGSTISVINLRFAGQLLDLSNQNNSVPFLQSGDTLRTLSWVTGGILLLLGLRKMLKLRRESALKELLKEDS